MSVTGPEVNTIGYAAATMTTVSFLPQMLRVIRLRSAREISLGMFLIFSLFWLIYGVLVRSAPVMLANTVTLAFSLTILVLKLRFDRKELRSK